MTLLLRGLTIVHYQMATLRHTIPVEHPLLVKLIEKTMTDGLSQKELNKAYDGLCKDYEKTCSEDGYAAPNSAALAVAKIFSEEERAQKITLDIGAGTGLVAEEMRRFGFKTFDALDPSEGMLEIAKEKGLYRNCICEAIDKGQLSLPAASYDIVTVVGSHAVNHIKSEALYEMIRLTKPGGIICIAARMESFKNLEEYKDFYPLCYELEKAGRWQIVESSSCPYFKKVDGDEVLMEGAQVLYKVL